MKGVIVVAFITAYIGTCVESWHLIALGAVELLAVIAWTIVDRAEDALKEPQ